MDHQRDAAPIRAEAGVLHRAELLELAWGQSRRQQPRLFGPADDDMVAVHVQQHVTGLGVGMQPEAAGGDVDDRHAVRGRHRDAAAVGIPGEEPWVHL